MALKPGVLTFTEDRLRAVWRDPRNHARGSMYDRQPLVNFMSKYAFPSAASARELCLKLYEDVCEPEGHVARLDKTFSDTYWDSFLGRAANLEQEVLDRATEILGQLPSTSPTISGVLPYHGPFNDEFVSIPNRIASESRSTPEDLWKRLLVVRYVDTIVLRLVLCIAQSEVDLRRHWRPRLPVQLLNAIIYLLKVSLDFSKEQQDNAQAWTIVCAFLWTSWQRVLMLTLRDMLRRQLEGFDHYNARLNPIRLENVVPDVFDYRRQMQQADLKAIPYLCAWSYRNLIEDSACVSTDLRRLLRHSHDCFGDRTAVCNTGHEQCSGLSSVSCRRFEHSRVANQEMHAQSCPGDCQRLFWDRDSFIATPGPRVIDITRTTLDGMRYCSLTDKTLTVSHVWSHGQGGRPDNVGPEGTGFNMCLHQRYSAIALSLDCPSYWMDTPCIPSETDLRRECVEHISEIFITSGVTLVCDRDIMSIDITDLTVEVCEKLLATLLVCDWNMRAWTLLESMRARSSLYLLCSGDSIVKLHDVLKTVYQYGKIDVVVPYVTRSYLLPPLDLRDAELFEGGGSVADESLHRLAEGLINIDEAAALLSRRHATRDEDDIFIWYQLTGDIQAQDAADMWKRQIGHEISTGALVSSAPRLQGIAGFHWAPARPTMPRRSICASKLPGERTFSAYDGSDTQSGTITDRGLCARWLRFQFTTQNEPTLVHDLGTRRKLSAITQHYLPGFAHGALLKVCSAGQARYAAPYPGSSNPILVVCGSHDGEGWEWRGIYEWERSCPLPKFTLGKILLI